MGTTDSLGITNIQEADAGVYQCRAANKEDSLDASATIQVQVGSIAQIALSYLSIPFCSLGTTKIFKETRG